MFERQDSFLEGFYIIDVVGPSNHRSIEEQRSGGKERCLSMERGNSDHPLLATKLAIPAISHKRVVPRPRLNSKLDAGMYVPFTLITAPAGFGKTTLIGTWIQQRETTAAWVTLESNDDELVLFWRYVVASLDRLHPVIGEQVRAWLQELRPPNIEAMLTVLINALVALPHDMLLVLDNYHVITAPSIQRSLAFLLEHMPAHFHLIIATRVDPPLPLARFRVRGQLVELRTAELRFTADEATAFLLQSTGIPLAIEDIAALNRSTEGWAAGLQLAALSLQGRDDPAGISNFIKTFTGTFAESQPPTWTVLQNREDVPIQKLSEREQEVLNLIARGLSNHEIAQKLVVTVSTIKTHLNNIYAKLHVHTRLQAVTKAYDAGVLRRGEIDTEPLIYSYFPGKIR